MRISLLLVIGIWSFCGVSGQQKFEVIYVSDSEGHPLDGSRELLIAKVNQGNPLRVGWEIEQKWGDTTTVMTHWSDGGFITVQRGHVFAQIPAIFEQGVAHIDADPAVFLGTNAPDSWVAVVGTNGVLRSKFRLQEWMQNLPKEEIQSMEIMRVKTMWAVPALK